MTAILIMMLQRYWMVVLPIAKKYWKIFIPLLFSLFLLQYLITIPIGSNSFCLGAASTVCFLAYAILEFFFKKKKSVELVNAYSEKDAEAAEDVEAVPLLIRNTLKFDIPRKIKLNETEEITFRIDSVKSVLQLAKSKQPLKNIPVGDFTLKISSKDIDINPNKEIGISEFGVQFPINFTWEIKSDSLGEKEIMILPNRELSDYLGINSEKSSSWVETIHVVEKIGWSGKQLNLIKYALLILGFFLSVPLIFPAINLVKEEITKNLQELENSVKQESLVLEEIEKDSRLYLDEEEIQWHLTYLEEYKELKEQIDKEEGSNPNYKIFQVKLKRYQYTIGQKMRKSYAKFLSDKNNMAFKIEEDTRLLTLISNDFQDSLFAKKFLLTQKDTLLRFNFSKICLTLEANNESANCIKEMILN